jgi:hypothetical protein
MRTSIISLCVAGVLLWAGAVASAQGKGEAARREERASKADQSRDTPTARADEPSSQDKPAKPEKAQKTGQASKRADRGGSARGQKGRGAQGRKAGQPSGASEKGKGKGGQQQVQAFEKQLQHEQAKHMERQARLARIRELAVQKGDAEMIARVDKLIAKEQQVFGRKLQQLQGQQRASRQPGATMDKNAKPPVGPADVNKPQGEVGAGQPKEKPAGDADEVKEEPTEAEQEKAKTDEGTAGSGGRTKRQRTKNREGDTQK